MRLINQALYWMFLCYCYFLISNIAYADCQGCCSYHNGVVCSNGITRCGDGSSLSSVCYSKGCNVCGHTPPVVITPPVITTPINGICGLAHKGVFDYLPSMGLCSSGFFYNLTVNTDNWEWQCIGLNKGTTATCDATKSTSEEKIQISKLDYNEFIIWHDCSKRGAVKFQYNAKRDTGNSERYGTFFLDENVPLECQQLTTKAYGKGYDRGHLIPANHLDGSYDLIKSTNTMTNILPQAKNMNRGAWSETEKIIECYRDIDDLLIIGGVIWGNNTANDYFIKSHGIATPDAFWKVIIRGTGQDERAIAWIIPNLKNATRKKLNSYQVTFGEIEKITGEKIPVSDHIKPIKDNPWIIPIGCNPS